MTPIKLEPGEGIDLHAQGLLLISREFAVNRSAPGKAKPRERLFIVSFCLFWSQPTLFTCQYLRLSGPMTELPGSLRGLCCASHTPPLLLLPAPGFGRPPLLPLGGGLALHRAEKHLDRPSILNGHILPRMAQPSEGAEVFGSPERLRGFPDKKGRYLDNLLADT